MFPLRNTEIGGSKKQQPRHDDPKVAVGLTARPTAYNAQQGNVLVPGREVELILDGQTFIPVGILADHVLRTGNQHGQAEQHHRPADEAQHKPHLMFGEKEESQSHDAIELDECPYQHGERGPMVFFPFHHHIRQQQDGSNHAVELSLEYAVQHFHGTKPQDEDLTILREPRHADSPVQNHRHGYQPQGIAYPKGQHGKGSHKDAEGRAIVILVSIFVQILAIERHLLDGVFIDVAENVIRVVWHSVEVSLQEDEHRHQQPQHKQRAIVTQILIIEPFTI